MVGWDGGVVRWWDAVVFGRPLGWWVGGVGGCCGRGGGHLVLRSKLDESAREEELVHPWCNGRHLDIFRHDRVILDVVGGVNGDSGGGGGGEG